VTKLNKVLLLAGFCMAGLAQAQPHYLRDLASIQHALDSGRQVAVNIDLSQCTRTDGAPVSPTKGGLARIDTYLVKADGTLSFSEEHFTVTGSGAPTQQFMRYQVLPDDSVVFNTYAYSLPAMSLIGHVTYDCAIDRGMRFVAASD